jgi:hypothetical protein
MSNFLILIGGPGLFKSCDPGHDKTWVNYFYPMKVAAEENLYVRGADRVHWIVYEPAYKKRWLEDSEITFFEGLYEKVTGRELHEVRKRAADKVTTTGSKNYLDHIKQNAVALNIVYKGITAPNDFWKYLASFQAQTISRVWFSGHATSAGLILELTHNAQCVASWSDQSTLLVTSIVKNKHLANRFMKNSAKPSKFYGCSTSQFAETWHKTFGVPTEGAASSITFKHIYSNRKDILNNLQTKPTPQGSPQWKKFSTKP